MAEFVCLDGPLQGHVHVTADDEASGATVTVDLVGIDRTGAPAVAHYRVVGLARAADPGQLRFVDVRGLYRDPALPTHLHDLSVADAVAR